jgi:hypothetical protein
MKSYLGQVVRLSKTFLQNTGQFYGDEPLKQGVVVAESKVSERLCMVTVNDAAFGNWKALTSNIEVVTIRQRN